MHYRARVQIVTTGAVSGSPVVIPPGRTYEGPDGEFAHLPADEYETSATPFTAPADDATGPAGVPATDANAPLWVQRGEADPNAKRSHKRKA